MGTLTLYGLNNCDTCKKALKTLEGAGKTVTFVDIRAEADLPTKVPSWLEAVGAEKLLNKRSTTWRALSDIEQAKALADGTQEALIANPTLIKRPVIEDGKEIYVGWTKDVQEGLA